MMRASWLATAARAALVFGVYVVAGTLSLQGFAFIHAIISPVWLTTGIALAALLLGGYRIWPGVFAGAYLVNASISGAWVGSLGIAAGNTLEALAGAWLVNAYAGGREVFERTRTVSVFILLAGLVAPFVSSTFGVWSLTRMDEGVLNHVGLFWLTWWLGDAVGALLAAPVIVLWGSKSPLRWDRRRAVEAALVLATLLGAVTLIFSGVLQRLSREPLLVFLCLPSLFWAAFRFGPRETATAMLLFAGGAVWGTLAGLGPFARADRNESLLLLQGFMGVLSAVSLLLAAAVSERQRARTELSTYHSLVTHDVSNFCTTLQGLVERLLQEVEGPLSERQKDLLRRANRQSFEMSRLAENAKLLTRLREQGLPPWSGRVAVAGVLRRVIEVVRAVHFDRRIHARMDVPEDLTLPGFPFMENVFLNIIDNAVRYGPRGQEPRIEIRGAASEDAVLVTIRGGTAVDNALLCRIFDRYVKGPHSTGTGLGLAVIREIVERAGGTVEARNFAEEETPIFEIALRLPKEQG